MEHYLSTYTFVFGMLFAALFSTLFISDDKALFILIYALINLFLFIRIFFRKHKFNFKILCSFWYILITFLQIQFISTIYSKSGNNIFISIGGRIMGIILIMIPYQIENLFLLKNIFQKDLPSIQDLTVFSFNEIKENSKEIINIVNRTSNSLSKDNISEIIKDIPRHDSFRYINNGNLTDEYFVRAYKTLSDPNVYIVLSNTGSSASEIISLFTKKQFNHVSLSFDRELETIVSYNGGERIYPPGLNKEMVKYLNKKDDASIIVYKITVAVDKKKSMIAKIKEINKEGSAYNLLGLVLKYSHKPNIMFCSQFVYKMLENEGVNYFYKET
ncbi:MAG: hypothetical protein LBG80_07060 [Bacteroidales bacterium]|nr:hypothetical protein [Bacteroidales bacterium]